MAGTTAVVLIALFFALYGIREAWIKGHRDKQYNKALRKAASKFKYEQRL